jgi:hypothetical protein
VHTHDVSVPLPSYPLPPAEVEAVGEPSDSRPNRAARRGKRTSTVPASHGHGAAPHARGAQGRRVNPVRRTG